ncbi:glycoside hydrolase family 2 protein [Hymenobacter sp. GOD-10R]|uniref:glycoside hydrolase family 2 protein n=1 Tax=Hymenobacter sp. GOD-10R TaxID=3093922 RepID=UPI002D7933A2|nr:sugar-binding domain-containing protein [Hymenobacter sp. GOD-10R]WRQ26498.1 sugar-binding domain-containing protein [Hymenobacter sp. GOD-10R]
MKFFSRLSLLTGLGLALLGSARAQTPAVPPVQKAPIMSRWAKKVTPDNAWREYPRPQMVRPQWLNLNGQWDYAVTLQTAPTPTAFDGQILVPFCLESTLSGVTKPLQADQRLWYRRQLQVPAAWQGQRVLLHFGAVDYQCSLWMNGGLVGAHTGGSDPFTFDVTNFLKAGGTNELLLGVTDPTSTDEQPRGKQLLNPNGIWYTPVSGIWQTVWLEPVPAAGYLEEVRLTPEVDSSRLRVEALVHRPTEDYTTAIRLTALDGKKTVATTLVRAGQVAYLNLPSPKLWSPDSPFLYDLKTEFVTVQDPFGTTPRNQRPRNERAVAAAYAKATVTGAPVDAVTGYFAMRKISVGPGPIPGQPVLLLNNKFVFQNGPLDQGWWPASLLTPPSDEAMVFELDFLKQAGFNMLRKHIKVEPDRYYYHCDRLGLLVWQDMPSGFFDMPAQNERSGAIQEPLRRSVAKEQFELELHRLVDRLYNHPSIVTWVVHNEGWGEYDNPRLAAQVQALDPSRLVNAVSGWNDRGAGNFYDIHTYEPEPRAPQAQANRAIVIGEFGGIGWPIEGHLWNPAMRNWGYQTYKDAKAVEEAYQKKYAKIVEYYQKNGLSAAVYTQTTDVEGEINGLLTYDREVIKIPVKTLRKIHAPLLK